MGTNSFDRNYGMTFNSYEYFMGNNGFVTVVIKLPADVEIGETAVAQDGTDAAATALTTARLNQTKIQRLLQQRGTLMVTSQLSAVVDPTVAGFETIGGNTIAFGKSGTLAAGSFAITYMIERQDVFAAQATKPGAAYNVAIDPAASIAAELASAGYFNKKDGTAAVASTGTAVKVLAALPVLL